MALVRQDSVQLRVDIITPESRKLATTIQQTEKYQAAIAAANREIVEANKALKKANVTDAERVELFKKIAIQEKTVAFNLKLIAAEAKKIEAIDLNRLTPAQLVQRARQLAVAIRNIPQSAPEYAQLNAELARTNQQLTNIKASAKGIQDQGIQSSGQPGFLGSIAGRVAAFTAVIAGVIATLQGLFSFVRTALADFDAGAKAEAALADRIRSTAGAAGRSVEQLTEQAKELQKVTLFPDEVTEKGQELLLTFTSIRDEIFDRTIPLAQDLSTVFGQDMAGSATLLGKALNDPARGLTALRRVGVGFTEDQEKLIKKLVETGDVAGAQTVILDELERQIGGAARAAAQAGSGPFQLLRQRYEEIRESIGELIARGLERLRPTLESVIEFFEALTEALLNGERATGKYADEINFAVGALKVIYGVLNAVYQVLKLQFEIYSTIAAKIREFVEAGLRIPLVGDALRLVVTPLRLIYDAITNLPATWAGVVAAVKQGAETLELAFKAIALRAVIFAKEIDLALSIKEETKNRLARELLDLRLQQQAIKAGKSVGEAYAEARNAAILATRPEEIPTIDLTGSSGAPPPPGGGSGSGKEKNAAAGSIAFLREQIAKLKKEIEETPGESKALTPLISQLAIAERQLAALERHIESLRNPAKDVAPGLGDLGDLTAVFGDGSSPTPDALSDEGIRAALVAATNDAIVQDEAETLSEIDELRVQAGIKQMEDDEKRREELAELRRIDAQEARDLAFQGAEAAAQTFFNIQSQNIDRERDAQLQALDAQYAARLKAAEGDAALQEAIQKDLERKKGEIELEAARKRRALALKEAIISGALAVVKALPNIAAAIAAGIAAAAQIAAIRSQKFAAGGYTGQGFGRPDETGYRQAGIVHEGEYVIPKRIVQDRSTTPVLRYLEARRMRGYAEGGFVLPAQNTTPSTVSSVAVGGGAAADFGEFLAAVAMFRQAVGNFPREVRARVVLTELERRSAELNAVRDQAAF